MEQTARQFIKGLFQAERRNMQQMAEMVEGADQQNLQYLLSDAKWDHREVQRQVARDANAQMGGHEESCLIVDESGFGKKGRHSAGVARQWNGRLGKVENSQVGVFAALSYGTAVSIIGAQLYLPQEWTKSPRRCRAAGIPKEARTFRRKSDIALDLINDAHEAGVVANWNCFDAGYGKEPGFLRAVDDRKWRFMADVHRDQRIYLEDPQPQPAAVQRASSRRSTRLTTHATPITVEKWAANQAASAWQTLTLRPSTVGPLQVQALSRRVWLWNREESAARQWTVVVVREIDNPKEIHYALSNAPADTPLLSLAQIERQRFWVEHAFGDAKSELGMAHYEVRTWVGWHRHMTLCMMAQLFTLEERLRHAEDIPLLSSRDIRGILAQTLPRHQRKNGEIFAQIQARHKQRWDSTRSRYEKLGFTPEYRPIRKSTM